MLTLVTGASASGKSEYAEGLAATAGGRLCYIATMQPSGNSDTEFAQRVARHREQRNGKGFETLECPTQLAQLNASAYDTALLECLSNLAANELYAGAGENTLEEILEGVRGLCKQCKNVIVVTNEVFAGSACYDEFTEKYLCVLGELNCKLSAMAHCVVEVVYTLPVMLKNEEGEGQ